MTRKTLHKTLFLTSIFVLFLGVYVSVSEATSFTLTNQGIEQTINTISSKKTAKRFYNKVRNRWADVNTAYFWLYEDSAGEISLGMIFNVRFSTDETRSGGKAQLNISGLSTGATIIRKDGKHDIYDTSGDVWDFSFRWGRNRTDGAVIGGLDADSIMNLSIDVLSWTGIFDNNGDGYDDFFFLSANENGGYDKISLFHNSPVNFCIGQSCDTLPAPVPEPATMLLLGSGLVGLGVFRKKMIKK